MAVSAETAPITVVGSPERHNPKESIERCLHPHLKLDKTAAMPTHHSAWVATEEVERLHSRNGATRKAGLYASLWENLLATTRYRDANLRQCVASPAKATALSPLIHKQTDNRCCRCNGPVQGCSGPARAVIAHFATHAIDVFYPLEFNSKNPSATTKCQTRNEGSAAEQPPYANQKPSNTVGHHSLNTAETVAGLNADDWDSLHLASGMVELGLHQHAISSAIANQSKSNSHRRVASMAAALISAIFIIPSASLSGVLMFNQDGTVQSAGWTFHEPAKPLKRQPRNQTVSKPSEVSPSTDILALVEKTARRHSRNRAVAQAGLTVASWRTLFTAMIKAESNFRPNAVSSAGAIGLGQLMPSTANELGVDPHDPEQNLDGAARYLLTQLGEFQSAELALAAYNAGPGKVHDYGGVPPFKETRGYILKINRLTGGLVLDQPDDPAPEAKPAPGNVLFVTKER